MLAPAASVSTQEKNWNLEECLFISSVYAYLGMGSVYLSVNILVLLNHVKFCNVDGPDPIKSSIISRDENGYRNFRSTEHRCRKNTTKRWNGNNTPQKRNGNGKSLVGNGTKTISHLYHRIALPTEICRNFESSSHPLFFKADADVFPHWLSRWRLAAQRCWPGVDLLACTGNRRLLEM